MKTKMNKMNLILALTLLTSVGAQASEITVTDTLRTYAYTTAAKIAIKADLTDRKDLKDTISNYVGFLNHYEAKINSHTKVIPAAREEAVKPVPMKNYVMASNLTFKRDATYVAPRPALLAPHAMMTKTDNLKNELTAIHLQMKTEIRAQVDTIPKDKWYSKHMDKVANFAGSDVEALEQLVKEDKYAEAKALVQNRRAVLSAMYHQI